MINGSHPMSRSFWQMRSLAPFRSPLRPFAPDRHRLLPNHAVAGMPESVKSVTCRLRNLIIGPVPPPKTSVDSTTTTRVPASIASDAVIGAK